MQELFIKSLQMIKVLDIKKQSEYERIITYFLVTFNNTTMWRRSFSLIVIK